MIISRGGKGTRRYRKTEYVCVVITYANLVYLSGDAHKLVTVTQEKTIQVYPQRMRLNEKQMEKVNKLRKQAGLTEIECNT